MAIHQGTIVLMGSGELTATMVELHKSLLSAYGPAGLAAFIDTPAGFQLNVDHITRRACDYFEQRVQHTLHPASYKAARPDNPVEAERALATLHRADYILIGPGSPSYALQQWRQSPIPGMLVRHIEKGGCLVAASAAALTMGSLTLPVYEIYKAGQAPHWLEGLDILGHFGLNLVVMPHWNNAEGGNHDTRYCFMGEPRLQTLERLIPGDAQILGLDEHTAMIIDLDHRSASVHGLGRVTLRRGARQWTYARGDRLSLSRLRGEAGGEALAGAEPQARSLEIKSGQTRVDDDIWKILHDLADGMRAGLDQGEVDRAAAALLEMERQIWRSRDALEEQEALGGARELFRELLALLASRAGTAGPSPRQACLAPLVERLMELRTLFRQEKKYAEADALRRCLQKADVTVEDTPTGPRWLFAKGDLP
jgi:peptidase E